MQGEGALGVPECVGMAGVGTVLISQRTSLKLIEVMGLAEGHISRKQQSRGLQPGSQAPRSVSLALTCSLVCLCHAQQRRALLTGVLVYL